MSAIKCRAHLKRTYPPANASPAAPEGYLMITLAEELILLAIEDDGAISYTAGAPGFAPAPTGLEACP